jgi:opacity protein-like surface antigen
MLSSVEEHRETPDTSFTRDYRDDRNFGVNLVALRVWGARRGGSFSSYWGLGPTAGYRYSRQEYSSPPSGDFRSHDWSAGVAGVLGAEWQATEGLSLLAEYGLTAAYSWQKEERRDDEGELRETRTKSVRVDSREVRLGLTVWFN